MLKIIPKKKTVFWQVHDAGLVNQIMSVEIGSSIAFMENMQILFFDYILRSEPIYSSAKNHNNRFSITKSYNPHIFEILDLPEELKFSYDNKPKIEDCTNYTDTIKYYYKCKEGKFEEEFSDGRIRLVMFPERNSCFKTNNLAFYSRFFFNRPSHLDKFLSKIRIKKEYYDLATKIANFIGPFSGLHYRLTDHGKFYPIQQQKRVDTFAKINVNKLPVIIATDDIQQVKKEIDGDYIFIDDLIMEGFLQDFKNLTFHNEVVFGIISLLVMSFSEYFIGTPGSTFSNYIHRLRFMSNKKDCFLCTESNHIDNNYSQTGPFTWNGMQAHANVKSWWREYPECKLNF